MYDTPVILQDNVGGLEYLQGGTWHAVPAVPGSLVINAGDYLQLLRPSMISPIHRVVAPVLQHRTSFVLFYYPSFFTPLALASPTGEAALGEGGAEGAGREMELQGKGGKMAFNTLLQGLPEKREEQVSFGSHIIRKWAGVRRY